MRFNISHIPEAQLEQTINEWTIHNNWAKQEREYYRYIKALYLYYLIIQY